MISHLVCTCLYTVCTSFQMTLNLYTVALHLWCSFCYTILPAKCCPRAAKPGCCDKPVGPTYLVMSFLRRPSWRLACYTGSADFDYNHCMSRPEKSTGLAGTGVRNEDGIPTWIIWGRWIFSWIILSGCCGVCKQCELQWQGFGSVPGENHSRCESWGSSICSSKTMRVIRLNCLCYQWWSIMYQYMTVSVLYNFVEQRQASPHRVRKQKFFQVAGNISWLQTEDISAAWV